MHFSNQAQSFFILHPRIITKHFHLREMRRIATNKVMLNQFPVNWMNHNWIQHPKTEQNRPKFVKFFQVHPALLMRTNILQLQWRRQQGPLTLYFGTKFPTSGRCIGLFGMSLVWCMRSVFWYLSLFQRCKNYFPFLISSSSFAYEYSLHNIWLLFRNVKYLLKHVASC